MAVEYLNIYCRSRKVAVKVKHSGQVEQNLILLSEISS